MKRMILNTRLLSENLEVDKSELPDEVTWLSTRLQLLYDVPLAYIIPEPSFLPPESIRFFYIDENFIKAMLNGATAIGRSQDVDKMADKVVLPAVIDHSRNESLGVRWSKVHKNHHKALSKMVSENADRRTGFLLRSSLVHRRKGIVVRGCCGGKELLALRLDMLAKDIMIGIFDGELTSLSISEPQCGLRFGCHGSDFENPVISLKDIGTPIKGEYYNLSVNNKGRADVMSAAKQINAALKSKKETDMDISSGIFAYELLLAAQKAEFLKKEDKK